MSLTRTRLRAAVRVMGYYNSVPLTGAKPVMAPYRGCANHQFTSGYDYGLHCNSWCVGENLKLPVFLLLLSPQGFFPGKGAAAKLLPVQPIFPGKRDGTLIAVLLFKIRI